MPTKSSTKSKSATKSKSKTKSAPHTYSYARHYASYSDGSHHIEEVSQLEQQNDKVKLNNYQKKVDGKVVKTGKATPSSRSVRVRCTHIM